MAESEKSDSKQQDGSNTVSWWGGEATGALSSSWWGGTGKDENEEEGASWWGGVEGWIQTAKEKSASALEFVKRDLGEFTCTVQSETEHVYQATSSTVKDTLKAENAGAAKSRMKEGINTLFQGITKALTIPPDDAGQKPIMVISSQSAIYDRSKARLHAIQVDPGTYLDEPSGSKEHFLEWSEHFDMETRKGDISELLVSKVEVRALYTKLVPAEIAHADFWQRYFYKLHQMALDEVRKQALIKRAERSKDDENTSIIDDWGSADEEDMEIVELPSIDMTPGQSLKEPSQNLNVIHTVPTEDTMTITNVERISDKNVSLDKISTRVVVQLPTETNKHMDNTEKTGNDSLKLTSVISESKTDIQTENENVPKSSKSVVEMDQMSKESIHAPMDKNKAGEIDAGKVEKNNLISVSDSKADKQQTNKSDLNNILTDQSDLPTKTEDQLDLTKLKKDQSLLSSKQLNSAQETEKPAITETTQLKETNANVEKQNESTDKVEVKVVKSEPSVEKQEEITSGIKTKEKGDMVIVGSESDRISPTSDSSGNKDPSTEDDWDKDFDLDVTEEDLKAAEELAKKMGDDLDLDEEDWENWE